MRRVARHVRPRRALVGLAAFPGCSPAKTSRDIRILVLVLCLLQMVGTSLFFDWLTIRAGSFWPAALAHVSVNSIQQGVLDNLQLGGPHLYVDVLRTGLILAVGLISGFAPRHDVRA